MRTCLQHNELWTQELEAVWEQQPAGAARFKQATLAGGTLVYSTAYGRLASRVGSRVLLFWETRSGAQDPSAAEVDYFLELQPATEPATAAASSSGSSQQRRRPAAAAVAAAAWRASRGWQCCASSS